MSFSRVGSYNKAKSITKSDTVPVSNYGFACRAIYVGGAGDVVAVLAEDYDPANPTQNSVTFKAPPVGTVLPVNAVMVLDATTATLLIALG